MSDTPANDNAAPASAPSGNLPPDVIVGKVHTGTGERRSWFRRTIRDWLTLRKPIPTWQAIFLGSICIAIVFGLWWFLTTGETEDRLVGPITLPSISETFGSFHELWFDHALMRNLLTTLRTVFFGFVLAGLVGIPLGVLAGCFPRVNAFLAPAIMFGRNIPVAAIVPILLLSFTNIDLDDRKVLFIFIACVAFVLSDTARAIADIKSQYIDTAYTLGASRWQTIIKVLVPMALPQIFDSFRIMFGLAFGYIMLAECITQGGEYGGIGHLINVFQRFGKREPIILIILIIPLVAFGIDRILFWIQKQLFPHIYGGEGILNSVVRFVLHTWDDLKRMVYQPTLPPELTNVKQPTAAVKS